MDIGVFIVSTGSTVKVIRAWGETPCDVVLREFPRAEVELIDLRKYSTETEPCEYKGKEGYILLKTIRSLFGTDDLVIE